MDTINNKQRLTLDDMEKISKQTIDYAVEKDTLTLKMGQGVYSKYRESFFHGFNHRKTPTFMQPNMDTSGFTFFVRPTLNMEAGNILPVRQLAHMVTNNTISIPHWARLTLDPFLEAHGYSSADHRVINLINNKTPFIPLLSNALVALDNVPSISTSIRSTDRGIYKEVSNFVDDFVINYESYDISTTFHNYTGNPVVILFYAWILYASMQYVGYVQPRPCDIVSNRLNYTSRIYRFITDHSKTYITNFWFPVYCIPRSVEIGNLFRYNDKEHVNIADREVTINWSCVGSMYNDHLGLLQFNQIVAALNPSMKESNINGHMVKLNKDEAMLFNYQGYPRVNLSTMELEWWVEKHLYQQMVRKMRDHNKQNTISASLAEEDTTNFITKNSKDSSRGIEQLFDNHLS